MDTVEGFIFRPEMLEKYSRIGYQSQNDQNEIPADMKYLDFRLDYLSLMF